MVAFPMHARWPQWHLRTLIHILEEDEDKSTLLNRKQHVKFIHVSGISRILVTTACMRIIIFPNPPFYLSIWLQPSLAFKPMWMLKDHSLYLRIMLHIWVVLIHSSSGNFQNKLKWDVTFKWPCVMYFPFHTTLMDMEKKLGSFKFYHSKWNIREVLEASK